jgi:hypothetical protein
LDCEIVPRQPAFCTSVRSKEIFWLPLPPLSSPEAITVRLGAALVLAMALVMSAVAAAPVTFAVLAGDALEEAVPVAVLVAVELPDELQAAVVMASAARMTAGTILPRLPAVNLADTMTPRSPCQYPLLANLYRE